MDSDVKEKMKQHKTIRVIRGCPCFKVFGDEKLCVNDDSILELDVMEMDPSFFNLHTTKESLEKEKADKGNLCYLCIYSNYPDNRVYCISQGWNLRIHGKDVRADELEDAMQFLSTTDKSASAELCSDCLYKFLLTLGESFTDIMSETEKMEEIKKYVDEFSIMIAIKLSETDDQMGAIGQLEDKGEELDHVAIIQRYLIQLQDQQNEYVKIHERLEREDAPCWILDLIEERQKLARLEFQFYSQVLLLRSITDFHLVIKVLYFILETSSRILALNSDIHSKIPSEEFIEKSKYDGELAILLNYKSKGRAIEHNFGNILQILGRL
ncbi:hypothetical protein EU537_02480 [Candidatus Thorarchaeota archaeon]|nr:MAG: hypothetical protein EU537_02480 [Candidatus Thorarchaeota archaeon]